MRNFLATALSVIAAGVLLIAYGLLSPRMAASNPYLQPRPMLVNGRIGDVEDLTPRLPMRYAVSDVRDLSGYERVRLVQDDDRYVSRAQPVRRLATRSTSTRVVRAPKRDWSKIAMVIGGTTSAGAGLGAIFGGSKGALIGAAIGGGAAALFEVKDR
jgi:hypothetical protein